jgi:alcohol dehydrogenase class IV
LQVPALGAYGLSKDDFPEMIEKASQASSTKGNPIKLNCQELEEVLNRAV